MSGSSALAVPRRGEVWLAELSGDKIRPIVVMTRSAVVRHLHSVIAVPVTSTIRSIPSELLLGIAEGLLHDSVANFDNLQLVPRVALIKRIGAVDESRMSSACHALGQATGC
jgi:mRNA interferase MazF